MKFTLLWLIVEIFPPNIPIVEVEFVIQLFFVGFVDVMLEMLVQMLLKIEVYLVILFELTFFVPVHTKHWLDRIILIVQ